MRLRRPIAFILSAAVAASALTGCDSFSGHAAAAANSAQVQQLIEFIADLGLERDLRQALQNGGDLRQALLTLLGLESAVNFNVADLAGARPGQHAVQVWEVTAQSAEDAAALAAAQIRAVLEQLRSSGVTEGRIGMVEVDGKYYVVVDVEVTEENTFEPAKPVSDDDDDSEDDTIPGVTVENGLLIVDVAELGLNEDDIDAEDIINKINEQAGILYDRDDIIELDLSDCKNLQNIDTQAFQHCDKLVSVTLPDGLQSIGYGAFGECQSLETVTLPSSVTTIDDNAFYKCTSLTSITLPEGLKIIDNGAFADSGLTEINLSGCTELTTIGSLAFQNCTSLKEINLNGCTSLESIGVGVFQNCTSLETITLSSTVTEIGNSAFWGCTKLTEIDLSNTQVNTIGNGAFADCTILGTVLLPASLTTIGNWAFSNCSSLENIYFYGTVVPTIGTDAFKGVISADDPAGTLTIHCPKDSSEGLKTALTGKGFTAEDFTDGKIEFADIPTLAYLLSL